MKKIFSLIILVSLCLTFVGCTINKENRIDSENENGGEELIPISNEIIENLLETKKVIIKFHETSKIKRTITEKKEIDEIITIISQATKITGPFYYPTASLDFEMIGNDEKLIDKIEVYSNIGNINFNSDIDNRYSLNIDELVEIAER